MSDLDPPGAFDILADETRVRILWALAEHQREDPFDGIRFSELRRRVGVEDSGNFDYHLDRLRGVFVEQDGEEYALTLRGVRVVAGLAGGAFEQAEPMDETALDGDCPVCGGVLTVRYDDGALHVACPEGHALANLVAPAFVRSADVETLFGHLARQSWLDLQSVVNRVCPLCRGALDEPEPFPGRTDMVEHVATCEQCGNNYQLAPQLVAVVHPAVTAFLHDHGEDPMADPYLTVELLFLEPEQVSGEPRRHEAAVEAGDEELVLTVGDDLQVTEIERVQ